MKAIKFNIKGVSPLLMHNIQLADPLNKWAKKMKEVSSKRKKTETDMENLSKYEFMGGLYVDDQGRPCIPGELIEGMLVESGKSVRLGKKMKSVICDGTYPVKYSGPSKAEALFDNKNFVDVRAVRVTSSRIMRTRPIFREWALEGIEVTLDENAITESDLRDIIVNGGKQCGIGDYRPKHGRFDVEFE